MENNDVHVKVAVAPSSENRIINHLGTVTLVPSESTIRDNVDKPSLQNKFSKIASKNHTSEVVINFPDVISTVTCSELVVELIKYLLYFKEHIPYQYDHLKNVVEQKKKWDLHKTVPFDQLPVSRTAAMAAEKYFKKAKEFVDSLELIFEHIRNEVSSASAVAVLFGATIASPKQIYIMEFPQLLEPSTSAIPSRRCLIHLFREFMTSETVQQTAARTLSPSNVYIFLRKPAKNQESWFCMKEQYSMSNRCNKVSLKFCQPPSVGQPKFKIYLDSGSSECPSPMCKSVAPHEPAECPVEASAWYQAQKFVHGFKDCWIGDQCATDLWMKI